MRRDEDKFYVFLTRQFQATDPRWPLGPWNSLGSHALKTGEPPAAWELVTWSPGARLLAALLLVVI